ncbi:MAG: RidA family protein [Sporichthyaceae bacterium]
MKEVIPGWMKPIRDAWHFAPAVIDGEYLRCSGMIGVRPDLSVPADPKEQFTLAFDNLRDLLAEAGLTFADVVELTTYHVGLQTHLETFIAVHATFIGAPYPSWSAVGITELALPGALVEIAVTARIPG